MAVKFDNVLDLLHETGTLNRDDPLRAGNVVTLPDHGQVVMTGDLHGYEANFRRLERFADLDRYPHRHVILHELIHMNNCGALEAGQEDRSCELLLEALRWKVRFPEQVHFLLGNHDIAQVTGREISKAGAASIAAFNEWVRRCFRTAADVFLEALHELLLTFPLAARCPTGVWLSHSLPGPYAMEMFDVGIFERPYDDVDLRPGGSVYEFLWGRGHTHQQLDDLAKLLGAELFVVGHQCQGGGYAREDDRMIILSSDHAEGCFLPIDLSKSYTIDDLVARIRFFYQVPGE